MFPLPSRTTNACRLLPFAVTSTRCTFVTPSGSAGENAVLCVCRGQVSRCDERASTPHRPPAAIRSLPTRRENRACSDRRDARSPLKRSTRSACTMRSLHKAQSACQATAKQATADQPTSTRPSVVVGCAGRGTFRSSLLGVLAVSLTSQLALACHLARHQYAETFRQS
jgi:hypothetical protein